MSLLLLFSTPAAPPVDATVDVTLGAVSATVAATVIAKQTLTLDTALIGVAAPSLEFAGIRAGLPGPGNGLGVGAPSGYAGQGSSLDPWALRM